MCETHYDGGFTCKQHTRVRSFYTQKKIDAAILATVPQHDCPDVNTWIPTVNAQLEIDYHLDGDPELLEVIENLDKVRVKFPLNSKERNAAELKLGSQAGLIHYKWKMVSFMKSFPAIAHAAKEFQQTAKGRKLYKRLASIEIAGDIMNDAAFRRLQKSIALEIPGSKRHDDLLAESERQDCLRWALSTARQASAYWKAYNFANDQQVENLVIIGRGKYGTLTLVNDPAAREVLLNQFNKYGLDVRSKEVKNILKSRSIYVIGNSDTKQIVESNEAKANAILEDEIRRWNIMNNLPLLNV